MNIKKLYKKNIIMILEIGEVKNVVFNKNNQQVPYYIFVKRTNPQCLVNVNEAMILFNNLEKATKDKILEKIKNNEFKGSFLQYCIPTDALPITKNGNTSIEVYDVTIYDISNNERINEMLINIIKEAKEIFINSKEPYNIATKKEEEIIYLYLTRKLFSEKLKEETANKIITIVSAVLIDLCIDYIKKNKL